MAAMILNCPWRTDGRCPDDWHALDPADDPRVRGCPVCGHRVTLCANRDEALFRSRDHRRVAVEDDRPRPSGASG